MLIEATYLASINIKVIIIYLFKYQLTNSSFNYKINLDIDFLVVLLPTQSESEKLFMIKSPLLFLLYMILNIFMTLRYCIIVFTTFICY